MYRQPSVFAFERLLIRASWSFCAHSRQSPPGNLTLSPCASEALVFLKGSATAVTASSIMLHSYAPPGIFCFARR